MFSESVAMSLSVDASCPGVSCTIMTFADASLRRRFMAILTAEAIRTRPSWKLLSANPYTGGHKDSISRDCIDSMDSEDLGLKIILTMVLSVSFCRRGAINDLTEASRCRDATVEQIRSRTGLCSDRRSAKFNHGVYRASNLKVFAKSVDNHTISLAWGDVRLQKVCNLFRPENTVYRMVGDGAGKHWYLDLWRRLLDEFIDGHHWGRPVGVICL